MNAERVRALALAALRGAVVAGAAGVSLYPFADIVRAVSDGQQVLAANGWTVLALLGSGAAAGVARAVVAPRSVSAAIWVWITVAVSFLTLSVGLWSWTLDALSPAYPAVAVLAATLGLFEVALQAAPVVYRLALHGALVGAGVCLGYAVVDLAAAFVVAPGAFTSIGGNDFDLGVRDGVRAVATGLGVLGAVLGFVTVAASAWCDSGSPFRRLARWTTLVVVLWGVVPAVLYGLWHIWLHSGYSSSRLYEVASTLLRGSFFLEQATFINWVMLGSVIPMLRLLGAVALHGLALGIVFSLLWVRAAGRHRLETVPLTTPTGSPHETSRIGPVATRNAGESRRR